MGIYIVRRVLQMILILLLVTVIVFLMVRLLPGDPILMFLSSQDLEEITQEQVDYIRHDLGLDRPLIVQYFENARFEWHPSNPSSQLVSLTDLGSFFFEELHEDPAFKMRAKPLDNTIQPRVLSLISHAFPGKAMALSSDGQTIYVIVQDQTLLPIANATVAATVTWPSGTQELLAGRTDDHGVATLPITFTNQPFGSLIHIAVNVNSQGLTASTTTSFRIWH